VTQSALSVQIQDLEKQLGVVLIERRRRGFTLTQHGEDVARRSASILTNVRDLVDHARQPAQPLDGVLRFGVIPTVAPYLLPPLLPLLRASYPNLQLQVRETQTAVLLAEIADSKLDVGLMALPVSHPDLQSLVLFDENFLLAVPPHYQSTADIDKRGRSRGKVTSRTIVPADLLKQERLLLLEEGHCFRDQALAYCHLQEVTAGDTLGLSSFATIVRMVANGYGFTLLPEMAVATEVRGSEIRLQRLPAPQPKRTLGLVSRTTAARHVDIAELAKFIIGLPR
jgi:LysR family transcriptional regulator, hydrogen peroxide-inducible genes activator